MSVEGAVEFNRSGTADWLPASAGDVLCDGDSVQTGPASHAALRLPDGTLHRVGENGAGRWRAAATANRSAWDVLRGLIHVITRYPLPIEYTTPFANAGIEGTEFVIEVTDNATQITVIEGVVSMQNDNGTVAVAAGQRGVAAADAPADALAAVARADDYLRSLDWARYSMTVPNLPAVPPDQEPPADRANDAMVWALLAEARLAVGDVPGAIAAAARAIEIAPDNAHAHTMLGFAHFANFDHALAAEAFERAIALDDLAPLPHLGLFLAWTYAGDRDAGVSELEIAVVLSPDDALIRSYAGKVYSDQGDPSLASTQVELAKELDANEPTPWLYATMLKLAANNPVDALRDLDRAKVLNGNQSVYGSGLALDADQAVRSAPLGRVYGAAGFERLALAAGTQSIQGASRDHSGHRLLADSLAALPRHQIARVNELWVSQLQQPQNTTAIPPQLAETNLFILDSAGPAALSFNEFSPLLVSNHWTVQGAGTVAGNDTHGEHLTVSGIHDRVSYSLGGFGFETEGFRENNDLDTNVWNAFVQYRPNAMLGFIGELRSSEVEKGDLRQLFHDDQYNPELRQNESVDSLRLGMHRRFGESSDFLAALQYRDGMFAADVNPQFSHDGTFEAHALDMQHLYRRDRWQLTSGANVFGQDLDEVIAATQSVPFPPFVLEQVIEESTRSDFVSAYLYSDYRFSEALTLTFGASIDQLEGREEMQREVNPKLGLAWAANPRTTVRAAAFSTLQGPLISKENLQPRLEPTSVAGFNQFFFGSEGDEVSRYALGIDRKLSSDLAYGMELSRRDISTGIVVVELPQDPYILRISTSEDSGRAYVYWTPDSSLAVSAELQGDIFDNNGLVLGDGFARLKTYRLPMQLKYFRSNGLGAGLRVTYVDQSGDFGQEILGPGGIENTLFFDQDQFWVVDASLTYRLRGRRGLLNLNLHNLFDEDYHFQDLDPENPRIMPDRLVSIGFTLAL